MNLYREEMKIMIIQKFIDDILHIRQAGGSNTSRIKAGGQNYMFSTGALSSNQTQRV